MLRLHRLFLVLFTVIALGTAAVAVPVVWLAHAQSEALRRAQAEAVAHHVASIAEYPLFSGNIGHFETAGIQPILATLPQLRFLIVTDAKGDVFATFGPEVPQLTGNAWRDPASYRNGNTLLIERAVHLSEPNTSPELESSGSPLGQVHLALHVGSPWGEATLLTAFAAAFAASVLLTWFAARRLERGGPDGEREHAGAAQGTTRQRPGDPERAAANPTDLRAEVSLAAARAEQLREQSEREASMLRARVESLREDRIALNAAMASLRSIPGIAVITVHESGRVIDANRVARNLLAPPENPSASLVVVLPDIERIDADAVAASLATTTSARSARYTWRCAPSVQSDADLSPTYICVGADASPWTAFEQALELMATAQAEGVDGVLAAIGAAFDSPCVGVARRSGDGSHHEVAAICRQTSPTASHYCLKGAIPEIPPDGTLTRHPPSDILMPCGSIECPKHFGLYSYAIGSAERRDQALLFFHTREGIELPEWSPNFLALAARRIRLETGREATAEELRRAHDEAVSTSRLKSDFMANISHELRTPLNAILGYTQRLMRTEIDAAQRQQVETIQRSADTLLDLISDILDFSKIEAGQHESRESDFELRECVENSLALVLPSAQAKRLELVLLHYSDVPTVIRSDPSSLQRVLINLLSNAVKFTDSGSVILRVMVDDDHGERVVLRISVTDTGIGIPAQERHRLFQPFHQLDRSYTRSRTGTGLGLVISKRLVEDLGGTLSFESQPGRGTSFSFTLPVQAIARSVAAARTELQCWVHDPHPMARLSLRHTLEALGAPVRDFGTLASLLDAARAGGDAAPAAIFLLPPHAAQGGYDLVVELKSRFRCPLFLLDDGSHAPESFPRDVHWLRKPVLRIHVADWVAHRFQVPEVPDPAVVPQGDRPFAGRRALVADDNEINRTLLTSILSDWGFEVVEAEDGQVAVTRAGAQPPDIAFLDVHMPLLDGIGVAARLRAQSRFAELPLVLLTADAFIDWPALAAEHRLDGYLLKPFTEAALEGEIRRHLANGTPRAAPALAAAREDDPVHDSEVALRVANQNAALADQMRTAFLAELPEALRGLEAYSGAVDCDRDALRERVHKLAGSAAYCGAVRLTRLARALERVLLDQAPHEAPLAAVIDGVRELLRHLSATAQDAPSA